MKAGLSMGGDKTELVVRCYASGHDGACEAVCLDLDLAVQAATFEEARTLLSKSIAMHLEAVAALPEAEQRRMLKRRVPLVVRLRYAFEAFWSVLAAGPAVPMQHQFTLTASA